MGDEPVLDHLHVQELERLRPLEAGGMDLRLAQEALRLTAEEQKGRSGGLPWRTGCKT
jgi:hypothetical protein